MPSQIVKNALNTHRIKLLEDARQIMSAESDNQILYENDFNTCMYKLEAIQKEIKEINVELQKKELAVATGIINNG